MSHILPVARQLFWKAWGGTVLDEDMPGVPSEYVTADVGGHNVTPNSSCWGLWKELNAAMQNVSVSKAFGQPVAKSLIEPAIIGINRCIYSARQMRVTRADDTVHHQFGGPPRYEFAAYPILFPANSEWGLLIIQAFMSAAYTVVRVESNRFDAGILTRDAVAILKPLLHVKRDMMLRLFQLEPKNQFSPEEIAAMFNGLPVRPPAISPTGDAALGDESGPRPPAEQIEQAKEGIPVMTYFPTGADWATLENLYATGLPVGPMDIPEQPTGLALSGTIGSDGSAGAAKKAATGRRS